MKERNSGWNLEQMFNSATRPKVFNQPTGQKTMNGCNSYVYEITNTLNQKKYIGYHKEGNQLYGTSSTNKEFKEVLASNQIGILDIDIVSWGSVEECKQMEYELLTSVDAKANPQYYNKHNGHPGKRKLNVKLVNDIMVELDDTRKHTFLKSKRKYVFDYNVVNMTIKELWEVDKWQVRHLEIDTDNLNKIKDRIKSRVGNYDMPVILKNITLDGIFYPMLLISGNHTRTAYWTTRNDNVGHTENTTLKVVVLDEDTHSQLQETEVQMLGNNLNSDYNVGKSFSSADAIDECLQHQKAGHSWKTTDMRRRFQLMGLTSGQVDTVFEKVEDRIKRKELQDSGYMIYDYKNTHPHLLTKKVNELTDNNTYVLSCASGAPTLDRWLNDGWLKEQLIRLENGKPLQTKICIVVYHTSFKNRDGWPAMFEKLTLPQHIEDESTSNLISTLCKLPTFTYFEMPMKTKKK